MANSIDADRYDRLLAAFREKPENYTAAAKKAGVTFRTAKKAWLKGWPSKNFEPIKTIIALEHFEARAARHDTSAPEHDISDEEAARARAAAKEAEERAKARRDAITARVEEAKMIKTARGSAIHLLAITKKILAGMGPLADEVHDRLTQIKLNDETTVADLEDIARLIWRLAISTKSGTETAFKILQSERLLLGQPTDIIGVTDLDNLTLDDAIGELRDATAALKRYESRKESDTSNRFEVISGGK